LLLEDADDLAQKAAAAAAIEFAEVVENRLVEDRHREAVRSPKGLHPSARIDQA
jgi:hypothetical protein